VLLHDEARRQAGFVLAKRARVPDRLRSARQRAPLGQLELKDPGAAGATPVEAADQVAHDVETIPRCTVSSSSSRYPTSCRQAR
jgi:hypothetical protein